MLSSDLQGSLRRGGGHYSSASKPFAYAVYNTVYLTGSLPLLIKKQGHLRKIIPEYRDAKIQYSFYRQTSGFNILRINGNEVYMDIHAGTSTAPNKTVRLK